LAPVEAIHANTGRWLGLISGDYFLYDQTGGIPITTFNRSATSYWKAGGLVALNLHMSNPTTGGPVYDTSKLDAAGLLTPGTATNKAFMNSLSLVAAGIRELQDAGVVVIFRPFHENGGDWFLVGKSPPELRPDGRPLAFHPRLHGKDPGPPQPSLALRVRPAGRPPPPPIILETPMST
jgi:mannan endo-1,4-beta-mannosidase